MPTPIWPPSLPPPLLRGFGETLPAVAIRTAMDAGPAKARRRATTAPTPVTIELVLTRAQVAILEAFHNDTTAGGTLEWDWKNHRTQDATQTWRYRFTSEPSLTPLAPSTSDDKRWRASFNAEMRLIPEEPPPAPGQGDAPPLGVAIAPEVPPDEPIAITIVDVIDPDAGWPDPPSVITSPLEPVAISASGGTDAPVGHGETISSEPDTAGPSLGLSSPGGINPTSWSGAFAVQDGA